jgi:hypothetical protein
MKLTSTISVFLYFQNILSSIGKSEGLDESGLIDYLNMSEAVLPEHCKAEGERFATNGKANSSPNSKNGSDCSRCSKLEGLTHEMEELSSRVKLETRTQEETEDELNTFLSKWEEATLDKCIEDTLRLICKRLGYGGDAWVEKACKGPSIEKLLAILRVMRHVMDDISNATDPCRKRRSKICTRYTYQSLLFIRRYLWVVKYCVDKDDTTTKDMSNSTSSIGKMMLELCRIDVLTGHIRDRYPFSVGSVDSFYTKMCSTLCNIGGSADYCIKVHFSKKRCLESLSKCLNGAFTEIHGVLNNVRDLFFSKEKTLNPEWLSTLLDKISTAIAYLHGSNGWLKFPELFRATEPSIAESLSLMKDIQKHSATIKGRVSEPYYEGIAKKINCVHEMMDKFCNEMKEYDLCTRHESFT